MASRRDILALAGSLFVGAGKGLPSAIPLQIMVLKSRSDAQGILGRLKHGEPFESLARQFSIAASAADGGHIGQVGPSLLPPSIRDVLRGLRPGGVSRVLDTPGGYIIVKVASQDQKPQPQGRASGSMGAEGLSLNYEPVTAVSGLYETQRLFDRLSKPADSEQNLQLNCELRRQEPSGGIREIATYVFEANHVWAQLSSFQGDLASAIERFQAAYDIAVSSGLKGEQNDLEKKLAIAYLRQAQDENWVKQHNNESSIFPLSPKAYFKQTSASEKAIQQMLGHLSRNPGDLEQKWLLNLAFMTLGKYPESVPKEHLISLAPFGSKEDLGRFVDIAPSLGVDAFGQAGGVIIDDFDNDGLMDIVVSTWDDCKPLHYYHNNGDGTFTDRAEPAGLSKQLGGLNLIQTDYNNDGWLDIFVLRGGWRSPMRCSLLRNNGDGTFTDVTREAGLAARATSTQGAVWADFDNDGWLDLFVANENSPSQLFHNNGNGTFTDVAHFAGVDRIAFSKAVVAGDYDGDGYADFYVSNYAGENFLYHNNQNGTFTDAAKKLHVETPIFSFPAWFFDYDNDGWPDLFVSSFVHSVSEVIGSYLGLPGKAETLKLYRNTGGTSFQDVTQEAGLARVFMPMGSNFGDIDNDGFLDFYLGTGDPSYASLVPNVLFKNMGGKYFTDITASSKTGSLQKGHGVAIADIFNDGQPCIYENIGGATPGDQYYSALFRNPGTRNNWISVKLVGVKTNRAAIGARIKLTLMGRDGKPLNIYRDVNSGGSFGASPLQQHLGLGDASRIETLEIWWPASKTRQSFNNLSPNQFIEVREFAKTYSKLERRRIKV